MGFLCIFPMKKDTHWPFFDGEGDGIGIFAHGDVVPVDDDWVKTKPFEPLLQNGVLYGRGVIDNKCAIIEALYALRALKAAGVKIDSRVTVYVGGCEEAGMQDIRAFTEVERMPAVSIVPDGSFPVVVGEKSLLRVTCRSKEKLKNVVKFHGGEVYNTVLDHVDVQLSDGSAFFVEGVPSHAANPKASVNAGCEAVKKLLEMPICDEDKEILSVFTNGIEKYNGEDFGIASEGAQGKLTCANGIVYLDNGHFVFTLDIRCGIEYSLACCIDDLRRSLGDKGFTMEVDEQSTGYLMDASSKEVEIIRGACNEVMGTPDAMPVKMAGATYARMLKNAYPIENTPKPWPEDGGGAHKRDEAACVESILKATEYIALIIARLDAHLTGKME